MYKYREARIVTHIIYYHLFLITPMRFITTLEILKPIIQRAMYVCMYVSIYVSMDATLRVKVVQWCKLKTLQWNFVGTKELGCWNFSFFSEPDAIHVVGWLPKSFIGLIVIVYTWNNSNIIVGKKNIWRVEQGITSS